MRGLSFFAAILVLICSVAVGSAFAGEAERVNYRSGFGPAFRYVAPAAFGDYDRARYPMDQLFSSRPAERAIDQLLLSLDKADQRFTDNNALSEILSEIMPGAGGASVSPELDDMTGRTLRNVVPPHMQTPAYMIERVYNIRPDAETTGR